MDMKTNHPVADQIQLVVEVHHQQRIYTSLCNQHPQTEMSLCFAQDLHVLLDYKILDQQMQNHIWHKYKDVAFQLWTEHQYVLSLGSVLYIHHP